MEEADTAVEEAAVIRTATRTGTMTTIGDAITVEEITIPMGKPNGVAALAVSVKSSIFIYTDFPCKEMC